MLICIPDMNSSIFPCLDDIYCVSGWMEAQKEECKSPCALQDFVPLWAAALLPPPFHFTIMQSRATGIAGHLMPWVTYLSYLLKFVAKFFRKVEEIPIAINGDKTGQILIGSLA